MLFVVRILRIGNLATGTKRAITVPSLAVFGEGRRAALLPTSVRRDICIAGMNL